MKQPRSKGWQDENVDEVVDDVPGEVPNAVEGCG